MPARSTRRWLAFLIFLIRHSTKDSLPHVVKHDQAAGAFYRDDLMAESPPRVDITTI